MLRQMDGNSTLSRTIRSLATYVVVFLLLLLTLAVISPNQFQALIDAFSQLQNL